MVYLAVGWSLQRWIAGNWENVSLLQGNSHDARDPNEKYCIWV